MYIKKFFTDINLYIDLLSIRTGGLRLGWWAGRVGLAGGLGWRAGAGGLRWRPGLGSWAGSSAPPVRPASKIFFFLWK